MEKPPIILFLKEYRFAGQYFKALIQALSNQYSVIVVHTSKLEKSKSIDTTYVNHDISFWTDFGVKKLFLTVRPTLVLITNIRSLQDIYIMSMCNETNINLAYIEHGLTLGKIKQFKRANIIHSVEKYFFYSIKIFTYLISTSNKKAIFKKIKQAFIKSDYTSIKINGALLYSNHSTNILSKFFDLSNSIIIYSGYPIASKKAELDQLLNYTPKKQVVFIQQPLIADKFMACSFDEEISILNTLSSITQKQDYQFVLKLHPRSDFEFYKKTFNGQIVYDETSTEQLIAESEIVIGYFSTALITAIKLKKPLLIFKPKSILTSEIDTFAISNNTFTNANEFEEMLPMVLTNKLVYMADNDNKYIGTENTHEDRYKKFIQLLTKLQHIK
jgi:CDP-glycerol glycerophosphotransferase (TagB/SpsB family)